MVEIVGLNVCCQRERYTIMEEMHPDRSLVLKNRGEGLTCDLIQVVEVPGPEVYG